VQCAHGKSVQAIRAHSRQSARVGLAMAARPAVPETAGTPDIEAARQVNFVCPTFDVWSYSWWLDPILLGHWPADGLAACQALMPSGFEQDAKTIAQAVDFLGLNIYSGRRGRSTPGGGWEAVPAEPGEPLTRFNWKLIPEALYWGPKFFHERYRVPIVITENGMSNPDWVALDGKVHDPQRIDYVQRYLRELSRSIRDGVPVLGYFHWSLMDNFEWAEGYRERFGLVYVNFVTQERLFKDSASWYRELIASRGEIL
ncbi:MAG: glycoside hydrolase family 1 protein, partial [Kiritimatiellia bacterium]